MGINIAVESVIIAAIGLIDLVTTLVWVGAHGAAEANPIFRHYLSMGPIWFSVMKMVLLMGPIFLLEWARRRRPNFTRWASRFAICAYVLSYAVGIARLNPQMFMPGQQPPAIAMAHVDTLPDYHAD